MSTLFSALVALVAVNSQTYDDCGSETLTINGEDITLQLGRDSDNSMMKITMTGPNDKWFGFVLGSGVMSGYAITAQGSTSYELVERDVSQYSPPGTKTSSGTPTATLNGNGVVTLERPYLFNDDTSYFDFSDLMTCQVSSISIAGALGSGLSFQKHAFTQPAQTFTSTCCTDAPTKSPSKGPTQSPEAGQTNPPTSGPTQSPEEASSDNFEICATAESITDYTLTVFRDATNEKVRIQISGQNTGWFGYGFGTEGMVGSYAVTVEGADSDNLAVKQRKLTAKSSPPGDIVAYGTTSITTDGTTVTGVLEGAYDAVTDFDFTPFLTCQVDEVNIIAAVGGSTTMAFHSVDYVPNLTAGQDPLTLTRESTCTCSGTEPTTTASANNIFNGFYVILAVFIASLFN